MLLRQLFVEKWQKRLKLLKRKQPAQRLHPTQVRDQSRPQQNPRVFSLLHRKGLLFQTISKRTEAACPGQSRTVPLRYILVSTQLKAPASKEIILASPSKRVSMGQLSP